ncbi:dihydrolipoamide acetyltransferase family protein [Mucilaginibacter celer]|uniref:Dihydrolipoamide acetyltransferase component of pyruvate dehydrogenase complex n=1 Tax=Mucilaginibacter celer TaxID=2305508 RepID=A0A494VXM1_9SPHI|nr:dihydrolipoamide acetyltransferase family protein [Mucilaginibacter celer]AYL95732.1 2-oxo acid dehydrogenase subunit E2 [Mucilaginibacter celer]
MAKYQLLLPKMGESVAEATVIKWLKNPGDKVDADEAVMEIATDKVDSDVPSPVAGKLVEQLYQENDVVQVGAVIAVIETYEPDTPPPLPAQPETPVADEPYHANGNGTLYHESVPFTDIKDQPELELQPENLYNIPGVDQLEQRPAPTAPVFKAEGRFYSPLVRNIATQEGISTDELDHIPGTGSDGRLTKDDLLNYLQNKTSQVASTPDVSQPVEAFNPPPVDVSSPPSIETVIPHTEAVLPSSAQPGVVDSIEQQEVVTEEAQPAANSSEPVQPTASEDAAEPAQAKTEEAPAPESKPAPAPVATSTSGADEIIEMDRMRRLIAEHMVMSKQTSPHVTSFVEADVTNLVLWREKVKNSFEKREGEKITFTPIFIEAVVKAIKDFPMINVTVNGTQIIKKAAINISMATALPNGNLIVPVIKKADELNLVGLTKAVNDLAGRARIGKLLPDDVKEGTFTITNVGSFGNVMGTPIINQPQVAILAVGAIKKKPAVIETKEGDMIAIRHMMFLSLSYDHRVVDGALGGSFVRRVADYLERWDSSREF